MLHCLLWILHEWIACVILVGIVKMKLIPLSKFSRINKGKYFAQVDDEDYDFLNQWNWHADIHECATYSRRSDINYDNGIRILKNMLMHRVIMGVIDTPEIFVDHIDHNGLNNQRSNLRICNRSQNQENSSPKKGASSKYKGVCWNAHQKKWLARIVDGDKRLFLGYFRTENEAAKKYNEYAIAIHKDFANLNKVIE